ncbi:MAG: hypothetical protein CL762_00605 [Chloroflexi bacterium]|nr:hypothetical protein [Chloroflexota bacterium]|tara:strand:+ start:18140 stop:19342 length:1203 start_codon:yes stop_codon:yes gene_type:complete
MKSFLASFQYSGYRILWVTSVSLILAIQMAMPSRALLTDDLTNSAFISGIVSMGFAPALLMFSILGGVIGDKFENRRIMQIVQIGFFASSFSTWILIELGIINWYFLFIVSLIQGALFSFQLPARYSFIPKIVPEESVSNGIALLSSGMALVTVFSGSAVGYLYGKYGPDNVFLIISIIQIVTFVLALFLPKTEKNDSVSGSYFAEMKKSFHYLMGNKIVLAILISSLVVSMIAMPVRLQLPIIARRLYMISPQEIGILLTMAGVGAVIGTILISTLKKGTLRFSIFIISAFGLGLCTLIFGLAPQYTIGLVVVIFFGAFEQIRMALSNVLTMEYTDSKYRARMMGFFMLNFASIPLGALPIGYGIDKIGAVNTLIFDGIALIVILSILLLISNSFRKIK